MTLGLIGLGCIGSRVAHIASALGMSVLAYDPYLNGRIPGNVAILNTARGGIVDEQALLNALQSGHLSGAGLDVFETEPPPPDHPLLRRHDVICTPHIAGVTVASKERLWRTAIVQALQVLRGEKPIHLVNPEVWPLG